MNETDQKEIERLCREEDDLLLEVADLRAQMLNITNKEQKKIQQANKIRQKVLMKIEESITRKRESEG
jgi:hypothetical protein